VTSEDDEPGPNRAGDIPALGGREQDQLAAIARREFHNRRRRDSLIRYDLFAEPAWDMLLDLYIQHHRGQPVTVDRLCMSAGAASTTVLRWLGLLVERELVIRSSSAEKDGVIRVTLSARGIEEMERYLRDFLRRGRLGGDIAAGLSAR